MTTPKSAFAKYQVQAWPYRYEGEMIVGRIAGGTPTDPKVAEGWLRTKLGAQTDAVVQAQVAEVIAERGVSEEDAVALVDANRHLNGFKRDDIGLFIEGRQLKAAIKEATMVAVASGKVQQRGWGKTSKQIKAFTAEHICVVEDKLYLGVTAEEFAKRTLDGDGCGIAQRFVHTHNGTGIQYEEYVDNAKISFTVLTDHKFSDEHWAMIFLTGEQQGIGATRSQGYGRYVVTKWDAVT